MTDWEGGSRYEVTSLPSLWKAVMKLTSTSIMNSVSTVSEMPYLRRAEVVIFRQ